MSRQRKEKEDESKGLGLFSSLLLAGGAAAVGFLAHKVVTDWEKPCGSGSGSASGGADSAWGADSANERRRKQNRSTTEASDSPDPDSCVKCIVCMVNPREIILLPCRHVCLCEDCVDKLKKCPVCNAGISSAKAVYIS